MKRLFVILALLAASCATGTAPKDATTSFADLESRLLAMPKIDVSYEAESAGPFPSDVKGVLATDAKDVYLNVNGTVERAMIMAIYSTESDKNPPPDTRRSVILGWTRMGLLHNIYRRTHDQYFEHAEGGIEDWVKVSNVKWDDSQKVYTFDIAVEGTGVATAQLWVDASGLPLRRTQTVNFPSGVLKVEERYKWR